MSKLKTPLPFKIGDEIEVRFESMASGGACKGTPVDMPQGACSVFTYLAAPGDRAAVQVREMVKRFVNADLTRVVEPSPIRVIPPCPVFAECGGCDWQHLSPEAQSAQADEIAGYVLRRAGVSAERIGRTVTSPRTYHYRSRGDLSAQRNGREIRLGFRRRKSHELIEVATCPQFEEPIAQSFELIREALAQSDLPEGKIVRVRVAADEATGRIAVIPNEAEYKFSPILMIGPRLGKARTETEFEPFKMKAGEFELEYHPAAFTQINRGINTLLVDRVMQALDPTSEDTILELFSGIGNFSLAAASRAGKVIAVENSPLAHEDAVRNAKRLDLPVQHMLKSAGSAAHRISASGEKISKVLADPPRAGFGPDLCETLALLRPERIVYVSCNLDSLAMDLRDLASRGYETVSVAPFDMFPQTWQKELLAVLIPAS